MSSEGFSDLQCWAEAACSVLMKTDAPPPGTELREQPETAISPDIYCVTVRAYLKDAHVMLYFPSINDLIMNTRLCIFLFTSELNCLTVSHRAAVTDSAGIHSQTNPAEWADFNRKI